MRAQATRSLSGHGVVRPWEAWASAAHSGQPNHLNVCTHAQGGTP
jgi:hypothetical protein